MSNAPAVSTAPASVLEPLSTLISPYGSPINSVQGASSLTTGPSGSTYVGYIAADLSVWIAWRLPDSPSWIYHKLLYTQLDDAHQTVSIAESIDGHIHVCAATHNSKLRYWRTSIPYELPTLVESPTGIDTPGASSNQISYPTLVPAGPVLWLIYRYGTSGVGDTHLAKYESESGIWSDVAVPLIKGRLYDTGALNDSQYLGNTWGLDNGDLLITWTARVSEPEPVNRGVFWERVSPSGAIYHSSSLPLTRFTAHNVLDDGLSDATISNSGLSITSLSDNSVHIGFNRYSSQGYREVYHARSDTGLSPWTLTQISNHRALNTESTRICVVAPLPCSLEIQGPQLIAHPETDNLALIYTVATTPVQALESGSWHRLPGEMYIARSSDKGRSWATHHIRQDIAQVSGEYPRDTSGRALILAQSLVDELGELRIVDIEPIVSLPAPIINNDFGYLDGSREVSIPLGSISHTGSFSIHIRFSPRADRIMALAGIEGEWRLFYFGVDNCGGTYGTGGNLQIVSCPPGSSWYIKAGDMRVGEVVDIVLVADGVDLRAYRDGAMIGSRSLNSAIISGANPLWIGGIAGYPQYRFEGRIAIKYYDRSLNAEQVGVLYSL